MITRWLVIFEDGHERYFSSSGRPQIKDYPKPINIRPVSDAWGGQGHAWDIERVRVMQIIKLQEVSDA